MEDQISGRGIASSTTKGIKGAVKIFNTFCSHKNYPPFPITSKVIAVKKIAAVDDNDDDDGDEDDEDVLKSANPAVMTKDFFCRDELVCEYAYYIVKVYQTKQSELLMMRTVQQYLGRIMQAAKQVFKVFIRYVRYL